MIFGLPWWLWLMIVIAGVITFLRSAAKAWRAALRADLIAYLRRESPDIEVVAEHDQEIGFRGKDGSDGTLRLARFYEEGTKLAAGDTSAREALFAVVAGTMREGKDLDALNPERDRGRVRPRLVDDAFLQQLRAAMKDDPVPAVPLGVEGLWIVFVLDSTNSVAYLTEKLLRDLGVEPGDALGLARENLSPSFDAAIVRGALSARSINVVKCGDTFDAARIVLVPGCLQEGEEVVALIPDRDTLVITAVPANGDWSALRKMARAAAGPRLWPEPVRVTAGGIRPA